MQGIIRDVTERKKVGRGAEKGAGRAGRSRQATDRRPRRSGRKASKRNRRTKTGRRISPQGRTAIQNHFRNTVVGLYRTTPDGRILLANPALIKMLGYTSFEELSRINLEKGESTSQRLAPYLNNIIEKEGRVLGLESVWLRRDGYKIVRL